MFKPDPPLRHRLIPPDWFVAQYNASQAWPSFVTALDPHVMALWHTVSMQPVPSPLTVITGI